MLPNHPVRVNYCTCEPGGYVADHEPEHPWNSSRQELLLHPVLFPISVPPHFLSKTKSSAGVKRYSPWRAHSFLVRIQARNVPYLLFPYLVEGIPLKDERVDRSREAAVKSGSNVHHLHKGEGSLNQPQSTSRRDKHI